MIPTNKILDFLGIDTDPILGIDIGSTAVKVLGLSKTPSGIRVDNFALEPLEPGVVLEKNIVDRERAAAAVRQAVENSKAKTKKVCISLPNSMSVTRMIKMSSDMNDKDIGSEIELEAERYIPYKLSDINLDYRVVGPTDNPDLVNVLLAASKKDNVESLSGIMEDAGLIVKIVDIDAFAIGRSFELGADKFPNEGKDKIIAVFDIGASLTTLNVFNQGNVVYTREQSFGSQQLVDEVQNVYGLTYGEANLAIRYESLPKDYYSEILNPFKHSVAQQISRFCQFFLSSGDYAAIDYILLTGGCSQIFGLDQLVQDKMHVKTLTLDPFVNMSFAPSVNIESFKSEAPRLAKCCGLALRNTIDD